MAQVTDIVALETLYDTPGEAAYDAEWPGRAAKTMW